MGKELFKNIPSKVEDLVKGVRNGRIGLPDLQRPFVWKDNKVRELFDSMLKGYDQQVWVDIGHSNFSSYLKLLINLHSQYSSTQKLYSSRNELQQ